nr:MAG TPA: hypothetical protein [Caudoviricetes sp.]
MAKTLIGNIKGKDGRGISKIEKTATTGVVDTYTITYTDSTQSTYEVRNSDNIAIQRQIVPSAAVESSATASQSYSSGDYVVVDGVLRKVTASIAKGNAISDSNSTATTVTGELATIRDSVSQIDQSDTGKVYLYNDSKWGSVSYRAKGGVCTLIVDGVGGMGAGGSWRIPNKIPSKFLPDQNSYAALCHSHTDHQAQLWVPSKDSDDSTLLIYTAIDTTDSSARVFGIVSWVY